MEFESSERDGAKFSGRKRPIEKNEEAAALDLFSSQLLKVSCTGDEQTPRSIAITANENRVLRMPDAGLMFKQQRSLQELLTDVHEDPGGFQNFIEDIRSDMKISTDTVPSPFDTKHGSLDDYNMHESVGKGRFSVVYYSTRKRDHVPCALKRINLSANNGQDKHKQSHAKCLKEVGLLRSLKHHNIIRYLDSFLHGEELYIVLEWASKGDLKDLISSYKAKNQTLGEHLVWTYFSQCAEAIRHMHEVRIMHRDLKPSNVFVMEDGRLKLGDLGLGRYLDLQSIMAFSQVGTPLYMSPEVLRGEGHHFSSDIWSLGCMLYELAHLRSPFQQRGLTMDRLFLNIVNGDYPKIGGAEMAHLNYSQNMVSMVEGMLQTDSTHRPTISWVANHALLAQSVTDPDADPEMLAGLGPANHVVPAPHNAEAAAQAEVEAEMAAAAAAGGTVVEDLRLVAGALQELDGDQGGGQGGVAAAPPDAAPLRLVSPTDGDESVGTDGTGGSPPTVGVPSVSGSAAAPVAAKPHVMQPIMAHPTSPVEALADPNPFAGQPVETRSCSARGTAARPPPADEPAHGLQQSRHQQYQQERDEWASAPRSRSQSHGQSRLDSDPRLSHDVRMDPRSDEDGGFETRAYAHSVDLTRHNSEPASNRNGYHSVGGRGYSNNYKRTGNSNQRSQFGGGGGDQRGPPRIAIGNFGQGQGQAGHGHGKLFAASPKQKPTSPPRVKPGSPARRPAPSVEPGVPSSGVVSNDVSTASASTSRESSDGSADGSASSDTEGSPAALFTGVGLYNEEEMELMNELAGMGEGRPSSSGSGVVGGLGVGSERNSAGALSQPEVPESDASHASSGAADSEQDAADPMSRTDSLIAGLSLSRHGADSPDTSDPLTASRADDRPPALLRTRSAPGMLTPTSSRIMSMVTGLINRRRTHGKVYVSEEAA